MDITFKIIGALGLILITIGVIVKNEKKQNWYFIVGGTCLEIYSIYIGDLIFIILQAIFTLATAYDLLRLKFPKSKIK